MGNIIRLSETSLLEEWLKMSNGLTSVFLSVLGLSGSQIAKTEKERFLIVWLLEHDQSCCGIGTVDFDIVEMPWDKGSFFDQKLFILNVLNGVDNKIGWNRLDYIPKEEFINNCIKKLRIMLQKLTVDMIDEHIINEWLKAADNNDPVRNGFPRCQKHNIFLSLYGCHICNDK